MEKDARKKEYAIGKGKRLLPSLLLFPLSFLFLFPFSLAAAHPVPRRIHDRTIVVHLKPGEVLVNYRVEVDEFTVIFDDLPPFQDQVDKDKEHPYATFTHCYAPVLADNLIAKLDGKRLKFECVQRSHRLDDDDGKPLGHLRCDFVFQAKWESARTLPELGALGSRNNLPLAAWLQSQPLPHQFSIQESNYELEAGKVRLSLVSEGGLKIWSKIEPAAALQERSATELAPGDENKLRNAAAIFSIEENNIPSTDNRIAQEPPPAISSSGDKLLNLLLDTKRGLAVLLFLAASFGAIHALTPGHGKTLVAAYLVGEQGTIWHALVLGLVTTLTHTGAVLALAAVLLVLYPDTVPADVQTALGAGGGLLVAGLGVWLLLRRLGGQADHFHIGGHSHHHHPHDHPHDEQGKPISIPSQPVGWWGLIVLGISGGIVPCWDAIAMFGFAVSSHRLWLGLPLLLAFSAGLAAVLIVIGVLVVSVKGFAASRFRAGKLFRSLPLLSAVLVTGLGLWLCYDSLHK